MSSTKPCPNCGKNMIIEHRDGSLAVDLPPDYWACMCGHAEEIDVPKPAPQPSFEERWKAAQH